MQIRSGDIAIGVHRRARPRPIRSGTRFRAAPPRSSSSPSIDAAAAQKPLGRAARDIDDLAAEQQLALRLVERSRRSGRRAGAAPRAPHGRCGSPSTTVKWMPHCLTSAPVRGALQVAAIEPDLDTDLAAGPLHPFPARHLGDDRLDAARIVERAGIGAQIADRDAGHLRLGIGAAHRVGVDHRQAEMRRRHQRLDAVAAADLERHDGAEFAAEHIPAASRPRGRCCGCRPGVPARPAARPCWRRPRPGRRRRGRAATSARRDAPRHKAGACSEARDRGCRRRRCRGSRRRPPGIRCRRG